MRVKVDAINSPGALAYIAPPESPSFSLKVVVSTWKLSSVKIAPALRSLRWAGRFVTVGYASGEIPRIPLNLVLLKGVHVLGFQFSDFAVHEPDALRANEQELRALFESGRVVPHIGAVYSLDDVADALREVAEGRAVGKVVVDVAPPLTAPPTPRTGR